MLLVTQGKNRVNLLAYNVKTSEYIYYHENKEIWREHGDKGLLDYFNNLRFTHSCINEEEVAKFPIWKKYCDSCDEFENY